MKCVILVYLFYLLYHPSYCDYQQLFEIVEREHPKKANLLTDFRHLQYLNPVKVITRKPNFRRFGAPGNSYTLFPPVESRRVGVPDSPYFPLEKNMEARSRVKKIMADSVARYKRSAMNQKATKGVISTVSSPIKAKEVTLDSQISTTIAPKEPKAKVTKGSKRSLSRNAEPKTKAQKAPVAQRSNSKSKPKSKVKHAKKSKPNTMRQNRGRKKDKKKDRTSKRSDRARNVQTKKPSKESQKSARRIIAGRDTDVSKFPYVISIQKDGQHWCAGALLSPAMFISTANCFWKSVHITRMTIRAGSSYVDRGGRVANIQEIVKHPSWSVRGKPDYDVALGLLDRVLRFTDELHSVDIPNHAMNPPFEDFFVTSWGAVTSDGLYVKGKGQILQVYRSNLMDLETCRKITHKFGVNVSSNFFCLEQIGQTAPCTSDTGAPAVNDGVLWGLASWGIRKRCGTPRYPAMFSSVGSISNLYFITNATRYLMTDKRTYPFLDRLRVDDTVTELVLIRGHNQTKNLTDSTGYTEETTSNIIEL